MNPESEVDRRHSAPSFVAQGLSAPGAASLDAARFGTAGPCASKHGTDCLALNSGFRDYLSVVPCRVCHEEDWDRAITRAWSLHDKGPTVPRLDVLIAAIAIRHGVRLYALDAHFPEMAKHGPPLLYRPGYGGNFAPRE